MELTAKIYVAGHRGLVGSALCRGLEAAGYRNLILRTSRELDLTDQTAVADFFAAERPEVVFLAAAKVGGIWANATYPGEFIYANLMIQTNVLHQAMRSGVDRLLFLGSSCIYPREAPQPMREEHLMTGPLETTNSPYAVAKIAGIEMCWAYNRQYGTRYVPVMPTNLFGPQDNFDLTSSHVLPAMLRKFHLAHLAVSGNLAAVARDERRFGRVPDDILAYLGLTRLAQGVCPGSSPGYSTTGGEPQVVLWGSGTPRREFLHVDDLAQACLFVMGLTPEDRFQVMASPEGSLKDSPLFNVGAGKDSTIRELADLVAGVVGYAGRVVWDGSKPDGTPRKLLDVTRMSSLGWTPSISLRQGIADTYAWYLRQSDLPD